MKKNDNIKQEEENGLNEAEVITASEEVKEEKKSDTNEQLNAQLITDLKNEIAELKEKLLYSLAEKENMREHNRKLTAESVDYAIKALLNEFLVIMDNLKLSLAHKDEGNVIAGVELTKKTLESLFNKYHVDEINPQIGEKFDYNFHNAISETPSNEHPHGSVLNTLQVGYKMKDKLLRPAFVAVSKTK